MRPLPHRRLAAFLTLEARGARGTPGEGGEAALQGLGRDLSRVAAYSVAAAGSFTNCFSRSVMG